MDQLASSTPEQSSGSWLYKCIQVFVSADKVTQKVSFWWSCNSTKAVKRLFGDKKEQSALLRIIQGCQVVGVKRQITVAGGLQTNADPITAPLCLSICLSSSLPSSRSCSLLHRLLNLLAWHVSQIKKKKKKCCEENSGTHTYLAHDAFFGCEKEKKKSESVLSCDSNFIWSVYVCARLCRTHAVSCVCSSDLEIFL